MNAAQYCAEYGKEAKTGRVYFTRQKVDKFIILFTHLEPTDFTEEMRERLKVGVMIDLYNEGIENWKNTKDQEPDKIEIPDFVFNTSK